MPRVYLSAEAFHSENASFSPNLPYLESTASLAAPLTLRSATIPNRLACQAMEGCDGNADGTPGELTQRRYDRLANLV